MKVARVIIPSTEGAGVFASTPSGAPVETGHKENYDDEDYDCYRGVRHATCSLHSPGPRGIKTVPLRNKAENAVKNRFP